MVESHDVGTAIQWFKDDSAIALTSDDTAYTIVTTLASGFEADSVTKISISTLTILNFDSSDVGSYSCRFLYPDPILADQSPEHALEILGKSLGKVGTSPINYLNGRLYYLLFSGLEYVLGALAVLMMKNYRSRDYDCECFKAT